MRVLVFGGIGKKGASVAFDLLKDDAVDVADLKKRDIDILETVETL